MPCRYGTVEASACGLLGPLHRRARRGGPGRGGRPRSGAATAGGLEGDVAAFASPTTLTRDVNICQINRKYIAISGTQEAVNKAGMKSEMAYRVINATKEIKRDLEMAMFQNTQYITGGATTARSLKGVAGFATSVSTTASVTAALVNSMLQTLWENGGYPEVMYVNGDNEG